MKANRTQAFEEMRDEAVTCQEDEPSVDTTNLQLLLQKNDRLPVQIT
jgi:hypothetical protein